MSDPDALETRRRRLAWRASRRGTRELDLLLGSFVQARLAAAGAAELDRLEHLVSLPDGDLLAWITGQAAIPPDQHTALLDELLAHRP